MTRGSRRGAEFLRVGQVSSPLGRHVTVLPAQCSFNNNSSRPEPTWLAGNPVSWQNGCTLQLLWFRPHDERLLQPSPTNQMGAEVKSLCNSQNRFRNTNLVRPSCLGSGESWSRTRWSNWPLKPIICGLKCMPLTYKLTGK